MNAFVSRGRAEAEGARCDCAQVASVRPRTGRAIGAALPSTRGAFPGSTSTFSRVTVGSRGHGDGSRTIVRQSWTG
jgi:hypothetical protein